MDGSYKGMDNEDAEEVVAMEEDMAQRWVRCSALPGSKGAQAVGGAAEEVVAMGEDMAQRWVRCSALPGSKGA